MRTLGGWPASVRQAGDLGLDQVDDRAAGDARERARPASPGPSIQTAESPGGACWSRTRSATSWSFRPDSCFEVETAALASEVRATTNIPSRFASSATSIVTALQPLRRDGQEAVVGRRREVPPEDRAEPLDVLQEHRLPLAVGADDRVVIGHRQLDDRVEARERAVPREHLLDGHPRVARAEDVDQPARRGSPRRTAPTPRGSPRAASPRSRRCAARTAARGTGRRTSSVVARRSCRSCRERAIAGARGPALRRRTSRRRRSGPTPVTNREAGSQR